MTRTLRTNIGTFVSVAYEMFLARFQDAELAAVATSAMANDLLNLREVDQPLEEDAWLGAWAAS